MIAAEACFILAARNYIDRSAAVRYLIITRDEELCFQFLRFYAFLMLFYAFLMLFLCFLNAFSRNPIRKQITLI